MLAATGAFAGEAPGTAPTAVSGASPVDKVALRKGATYALVRRQLLAAGWLPERDPACWSNVGGDAPVCNALPETESCSSDGHCAMHFAQVEQGRRLRIDAYGAFDQWNQPGREAEFTVTDWQASAVEAPSRGACPAPQFDGFLERFAGDGTIRQAFTAPLLKAKELQSDDSGDHVRSVALRGKSFKEFSVRYKDGRFHHIDADGVIDPSSLALTIRPAPGDARAVAFHYGMSEGNSYLFKRMNECWVLSEDIQAPSP